MRKDTIYLKPVGGLCNRMRTIDSAVNLANQLKKRLVVFWGRDIYLNCKYSHLFEQSQFFDVIEEQQWRGMKALFPYLPGSRPTSAIRKALYKFTRSSLDIKREIWFEDFERAIASSDLIQHPAHLKTMQDYEAKVYPYIDKLLAPIKHSSGSSFICSAWRLVPGHNYSKHFIPINSLASQTEQITKNFANTVGVHIRRSDHMSAIEHSGLQKFILLIRREIEHHDNVNFFLATDCKKTETELLMLFPNKISYFPKKSYDRNSYLGIQEALIDLYCLSQTKKIFGSYFSSFSQVAAEISGIEEVTVS